MLKGLILSGGQSTRMGEEKRLITYHGVSQEQYLYDLLSNYCTEVFVSINANQQTHLPFIRDQYTEVNSPMVGILSAFAHDPTTAWLVVACDMPLVDEKVIEELVTQRNPSKMATAFSNPEELFPEPLLTIYEPMIAPYLMEAYSAGRKSAMKVLQNQPIERLTIQQPQALTNINTPQQKALFQQS